MGRLRRIEDIVNSTLNHYSHIKLMPRGLPRFVDPLLRGTVRFGKRTGNTIAVVNCDNTYNFETAPQRKQQQFTLKNATSWIHPESILSLGPEKELVRVKDISDGRIVTLYSELNRDYSDTDQVLLHSHPIKVFTAINSSDTEITVSSYYHFANGDYVSFLHEDALLDSITQVQVARAEYAGTTADPLNPFLYTLYLKGPLGHDFDAGERVYLRAYPAYFSTAIKVPNNLYSSTPMGPFLGDIVSGRLVEGNAIKETLAIKTIDRSGNYVVGAENSFVTSTKNFLINSRPMNTHMPLFWQLAEGTMRITGNRIVMKVNDNSQFCVGYRCVPAFSGGMSWRVSLISTVQCSIRFWFKPLPWQEFDLIANVVTPVTITLPVGTDIESIMINIQATSPVGEIAMSDWTPIGATVDSVQYSLVAETIGQAGYQSTGLVIKPFFLDSDLLQATYDSGDTCDGGKVYF